MEYVIGTVNTAATEEGRMNGVTGVTGQKLSTTQIHLREVHLQLGIELTHLGRVKIKNQSGGIAAWVGETSKEKGGTRAGTRETESVLGKGPTEYKC